MSALSSHQSSQEATLSGQLCQWYCNGHSFCLGDESPDLELYTSKQERRTAVIIAIVGALIALDGATVIATVSFRCDISSSLCERTILSLDRV